MAWISSYFAVLLVILVRGDAGDGDLEIEIKKGGRFRGANAQCSNLAPGLNRFRRGLDITKLDFLSLQVASEDGYKGPIVDFTCSDGKKVFIKTKDGVRREYDMPDQVWDIASVPGGMLNAHVHIIKTSKAVRKEMSANAGVESMGGFFSASGTYKKISNSLKNDSKYIESVKSYVSASRADMVPFWSLSVSRHASSFIERMLPKTFEEAPAKYAQFIRYFGTHYFTSAKFGGVLNLELETEQSYFLGKTDQTVTANAQASFFGIVKADGGYVKNTKKVDEDFQKKTTNKIQYHGGDANLLSKQGLILWQPTVTENPWIFGGQLEEISMLITDQAKAKSMKRAVQVYRDKARLKEMQNEIYAILKITSSERQRRLEAHLRSSNTLLKHQSPSHDDVSKLCNLIESALKVDGNWTGWSGWTIHGNIRTRQRTCTNPAPTNGGRACSGTGKQTQRCLILIGSTMCVKWP